jgi:hypothetical protein
LGIFDGVLLATDADGTLLNRMGEVTHPVLAALRSFTARGGLLTVATGRSMGGFAALRPLLPLNAPAILSNGANIYDYEARQEIFAEWMEGPFEDALRDILARFPGLGTELHWPGRVCILNRNRWNDYHMDAVKCEYEDIKDPDEAPPPWLKLLFVDEPETLWKVADYAIPRFGKDYSFFFSAPCLLEMQNAGVDKAKGVAKLADMFEIKPENVYTVGDAGNDIGMLRAFESFAPSSGTAEAQAAADHIVPGCDEDGLAAVVKFLEKRYG